MPASNPEKLPRTPPGRAAPAPPGSPASSAAPAPAVHPDPRILILHATAGSGHKRAAQALERAFSELAPHGRVRVVDTLHFASEVFRRGYSPTYNMLVGR